MNAKKEEQQKRNKENMEMVTGNRKDPGSEPRKYTHTEAAERSNAKLYEVHSVMENELLRMRRVNDTIFETSQKLNKTNTTYDKYGENLTQNRSILKTIYRTQIMQNIIENIATYFFFAVWIYIFWERFYIWEIISVFKNIFFYIIGLFFSSVGSLFNVDGVVDVNSEKQQD